MFGQAMPLTVLVVPCIATPIQNSVTLSAAHLPHFQDLPATMGKFLNSLMMLTTSPAVGVVLESGIHVNNLYQ